MSPRSWMERGLRALGRSIDALVRRRLGVFEYSQHPACIFRVSIGRADRDALLPSGRALKKDDPQVELHLWNEKMEGRTAGLGLVRDLRRSLEELAAYLDRTDPSGRLRMVHGVAGMVGGGDVDRLVAILRRAGFEVGPARLPGRRPWEAPFWETLYSRWLLYAYNPRASRHQRFDELARFDMWLPRDVLEARYGPGLGASSTHSTGAPRGRTPSGRHADAS